MTEFRASGYSPLPLILLKSKRGPWRLMASVRHMSRSWCSWDFGLLIYFSNSSYYFLHFDHWWRETGITSCLFLYITQPTKCHRTQTADKRKQYLPPLRSTFSLTTSILYLACWSGNCNHITRNTSKIRVALIHTQNYDFLPVNFIFRIPNKDKEKIQDVQFSPIGSARVHVSSLTECDVTIFHPLNSCKQGKGRPCEELALTICCWWSWMLRGQSPTLEAPF